MDRDLVVERALRTLNPPAAEPEFWAELEASLGAPRRRSQRPARWWIPAAAAIIGLLGTFVVANSLQGDTHDLPLTRPDVTVWSKPQPPTEAALAVLDFVDALGAGDTAAARNKLGPRSEAMADQLLDSAAIEGFGAWSASTDRMTRTIALPNGDSVVVLIGTVEQEGETQRRSDAFPVVRAESASVWFVEPWAFGDGGVDSQIMRNDAANDEAYLPASADTAYLSIDGAPAEAVTIPANRMILLDLAMEGDHLFTLVATGSDGLFTALAVRTVFL